MRMNLKMAVRGALLAVLVTWTASAAQNLIVNGSFEAYGGSSPNTDKGFGLDGWSIGNQGGLDVVFSSGATGQRGPYWQPADGIVSLSLNWEAPGSISQSIATTAGSTYHLTFFMAAEVFGGPVSRTMDVRWNDVTVASPLFQYTGQGPNSMGWTQFGLDLLGTGSDLLTFQSTTLGAYGPALDAVSLVAVPEPSSLSLQALAAACLVGARWQKKKSED